VAAPAALQLCARRMAAASGDMRRCLGAVRGALEILAAEASAAAADLDHDHASDAGQTAAAGDAGSGGVVAGDRGTGAARCSGGASQLATTRVTVAHMAAALGQLLKSPVVDAIKGLPQHAQLVLCAALRLQSCATKDATMAELEAAYLALCKKTSIRPEPGFSSRCSTLSDLVRLHISPYIATPLAVCRGSSRAPSRSPTRAVPSCRRRVSRMTKAWARPLRSAPKRRVLSRQVRVGCKRERIYLFNAC
jgi:Cdc6-like AAA superfamily ATPase